MGTDNKTAIYAPDTNFFIQCKDAVDVDWSLVSDADKVLLVVLNEVHREIDRLKSGGNSRRARRAKAISSQLRSLVVADQEEAELRANGPAVALRLAPRLDPKRARPDDYDPTSADERIAEEAKACSEGFFEGKLTLLSHDGMPLRAARLMGVQVCPIPDTWLLPPEPTEQDRAIQKLSERIATLEKQAPTISLRLDDEEADGIVETLTFYPPLSADFLEEVMDAIKAAHPVIQPSKGMATSAIENLVYGYLTEPSAAAIRDYEADHQEWLEQCQDLISRLPLLHSLLDNRVEAYLVLSNTGSTPAEHLVVDISAKGAIRLQEPRDEDDEIQIPSFPQPPKLRGNALFGGLIDYADSPPYRHPLADFRFPTPRPARDRHEFYWDYDDPEANSEHCRGECEDFRHGLKDERVQLLVRWKEPTETLVAGAIQVVVSARNMPTPIEKTIPVRFNVEVGNSEELVRAAVLDELGVSIR